MVRQPPRFAQSATSCNPHLQQSLRNFTAVNHTLAQTCSIATGVRRTIETLAAYFERLMRRPTFKRTLAEARPFFKLFPLKDSIPARFLVD
jgi:hypothetical protein